MTAAGVGSLLICRRQLAIYKQVIAAQNPYLIPVLTEEQRGRYKIQTSDARIVASARAGLDWLSRNFTTAENRGDRPGRRPGHALRALARRDA